MFYFGCTFKLNSPNNDANLFNFSNVYNYCRYGQTSVCAYCNLAPQYPYQYYLSTVSNGFRIIKLGANLKGTDMGTNDINISANIIYFGY